MPAYSADNKKIAIINSYHKGHPSSDEIVDGLLEYLPSDSFSCQVFYMDTKRHTSQQFIETQARHILDSILSLAPDLLIVADDNSVKYLVKPHLDLISIPVVFCGVNWTDQEYKLPSDQVTGMLEILPLAPLLSIA